jgi:hypothetical protein
MLPIAEPSMPEPFSQEPDGGAEARVKPKLRLSHPRWLEARGELGGTATACVDAEAPPTAATRVVFKVWMEWDGGLRQDLPDREGHIPEGGGLVAVPIALEPVLVPALEHAWEPPKAGNPPAPAGRYFFSAKHSLSDRVAGGPLEAGPAKTTPFDGVILYAPARGEYLWLPDAASINGVREP